MITVYADWTGSGQFDEINDDDYTLLPNGSYSFTHVYNLPGTYSATIHLVDEAGLSTDYPVSVVVNAIPLAGTLSANSTYSWLDSGTRTWLMDEDDYVQFTNVTGPNASRLEYHFLITDNSTQDQTEIVTNEAWCYLPDYTFGTEYTVEGWIENLVAEQDDPNATSAAARATAHQTFNVVCGSYSIPPWGTIAVDSTDIIGDGAVTTTNIPSNTPKTITFTLDPAYRKIWPSDVPLNVHLNVVELDVGSTWFGLGSPSYAVVSQTTLQANSYADGVFTFQLAAYPSNREINVEAALSLDASPTHLVGLRAPLSTNPNTFPYASSGNPGQPSAGGGPGSAPGGLGTVSAIPPPPPGTSGAVHSIKLLTDRELSLVERISQGLQLARDVLGRFIDNAGSLITAVTANPGKFLENLLYGVVNAGFTVYNQFFASDAFKNRVFQWLAAGTSLPNPSAYDFSTVGGAASFFLAYSGLTWDHLKEVIRTQIGAGNFAAIERVAEIIGTYDTPAAGATAMYDFLVALPTRLGSEFSSLLNNFSLSSLLTQAIDAAKTQLTSALLEIAPRLAAKFIPGAGILTSIYQGVMFVLDKALTLGELFTTFANSMASLARSINAAATSSNRPGTPTRV
jgi:hypothetical protein